MQTRSAVPRRTDWTASGALDWGFPRSAGGERRERRRERREREVAFTDPQQSNPLNQRPRPRLVPLTAQAVPNHPSPPPPA